jgi:uncharacterized membrane protein
MGRADVPLKALTYFTLISWIAWFGVTIAISSLSGVNVTQNPQFNALNVISNLNMLQYGTDGVITFFAVLACWLAAYNQTRQLRAMALFATTWAVFTWLTYAKFTFWALSPSWNCAGPDGGRWCQVSLAAGIASVIFEFSKVLLWGWALFRFIQLRHLEPFCELDKSEIEFEQKRQAGLVQHNLPGIAGHNVDPATGLPSGLPSAVPHVSSVPAGLIEADAPITTTGKRITALDQQRLSLPSKLVLFWVTLSTIGYMIVCLSFIDIYRWSNYDGNNSAQLLGIGDLNLQLNIYFPALTLLFSLGFAVLAAYDRLRDNAVSPLFLNIVTAMMCWGILIYTLRRVVNDPSDPTTASAWGAQKAQAAGWAILTLSETCRIGAMIFKTLSMAPAMHTHKSIASKTWAGLLYKITSALMLITAFAWFVEMIVMQSTAGLFDVFGAGATSPRLIPSPQSSLQWAWQIYLISFMIMPIHFAGNMYTQLAGTRPAVLSSYIAQVFTTAAWWMLCWPVVYSSLSRSGALHLSFCGSTPVSGLQCGLVQASAILGLVMFGLFVLNTLITLARLVTVDLATKTALPAAEVMRQGTAVTRAEAISRGTLGFGDTWLSHEAFLWLAVAGWLLFCFGATDFNTTDYFVGGAPADVRTLGSLNETYPFNLFTFNVAHFLAVAGLFSVFVQAHISSNKTYRDHSHAWRYVSFAGWLFVLSFAVPLLVAQARYEKIFSLNATQHAVLAGLAIYMLGEVGEMIQYAVYSIIYPAQEVTVMLPNSAVAYDKFGNPIVGALPIDVEKGETLNPHHDQAGLGTNYAKTDYRHQEAGAGLASHIKSPVHRGGAEKDSLSRDELRNDNLPAGATNESNTMINQGPNYNYGQV